MTRLFQASWARYVFMKQAEYQDVVLCKSFHELLKFIQKAATY